MKRFYVIAVVLTALAAACGGTTTQTTVGDDAAAAQSQDAQTSTTSATGGATETSSGARTIDDIDLGEDGELSLDDFIPGARAFDEDTDWRSVEMQIQQQVAECMAAEGFEYIPYVPSEVGGGFVEAEFDQEEYVKKYGFGIATWVIEEQEMMESEEGMADPWTDDPNQEIVEAMDEFEQEEYYRVLYGSEPEAIENLTEEDYASMSEEELDALYQEAYENYIPDGCYNEASEEFYGGGEEDMSFWEEFGDDFDEIYSRVDSDERIVQLQADWSSCMAESGYDYADQEEMFAYFYGTEVGGEWVEGEFQQKVNGVVTYPEPDPSLYENLEEGEEPEWDPAMWAPQYDIEELQPLIDEEIAVATADYECSKDMWEVWEEVYKEAEQQFIEENLDRLLAFSEANG